MKRKIPVPIKAVTSNPHYIGYLRVSKERDTTGSFTFETQEQRIIHCLDTRCGKGRYRLTFFKDDGLSGNFGMSPTGVQPKTRPTLQRIKEMIDSGQYEGVAVYGQSRFFRNTRAMMEMVQDVLLPNGKILISATEDIDITTSDGRLMLYMKALFDEKQREEIVVRNQHSAATRAESGLPNGQIGYGWIWDPNKASGGGVRRGIVPVSSEQENLVLIKDLYLSGWNSIKIAGELNRRGIPTPLQRALWSAKAKKQRSKNGLDPKWAQDTVWSIVSNPLHAGLVQCPNGERIQGQHWNERFWDPEVLEQLEQTHEERIKRFKTCTGQKNTPHVLNGIIFCARCGERLYMSSTSVTTSDYRSYKCVNGARQGQRSCPDVVVRAQWAEDAVVEEIARLAQEPLMRKMLEEELKDAVGKQEGESRTRQGMLQRKLETLERRLEHLTDELYAGDESTGESKEHLKKMFQKLSQKIATEHADIEQELQQIEKTLENRKGREMWLSQLREQMENFPLIWGQLDGDEKRQVLDLLIEKGKLTVDRLGQEVLLKVKVHFLPERERLLVYQTCRGRNNLANTTGLQRLKLRHMLLLDYAGQGKDRRECAELMGCKVPSIHTLEKTILKNLGDVSWPEAIEMTRELVEANRAQLPQGQAARGKRGVSAYGDAPFLSPVLMEVLELFARVATVTEVAARLHLSVTTVQGRRARILKHFGTSSMLEAVEKAYQLGVLKR